MRSAISGLVSRSATSRTTFSSVSVSASQPVAGAAAGRRRPGARRERAARLRPARGRGSRRCARRPRGHARAARGRGRILGRAGGLEHPPARPQQLCRRGERRRSAGRASPAPPASLPRRLLVSGFSAAIAVERRHHAGRPFVLSGRGRGESREVGPEQRQERRRSGGGHRVERRGQRADGGRGVPGRLQQPRSREHHQIGAERRRARRGLRLGRDPRCARPPAARRGAARSAPPARRREVPADVRRLGELAARGELGQRVVEPPAQQVDERELVVEDRHGVGEPVHFAGAAAMADARFRLVEPIEPRRASATGSCAGACRTRRACRLARPSARCGRSARPPR